MKKEIIYYIVLVLLMQFASAATIHGNIYNLGLEKQDNAVLSINTTTKQSIVAKSGDYSFELPLGDYKIKAEHYLNEEIDSYAIEEISIKQEGDYILDLILFPSFSSEEELASQSEDFDFNDIIEEQRVINYGLIAGIIIAIAIILFLALNYKKILKRLEEKVEKQEALNKAESKDESKDILDFIKQQNGRTMQKEIRDKFPSSEAKISLILTELEHKGIIEKIKKGRGNLIILKK